MVAALLVFTLLPLDAALPQVSGGFPLEVTLRAVDDRGFSSAMEIVHRNVGRRPIVVYSGWSCGGPSLDRVYANDLLSPELWPLLPPPPCRERTLVPRRLAPGASYATRVDNAAVSFGDNRVYATFTVVDERGRPMRTLRTPTISFHLAW